MVGNATSWCSGRGGDGSFSTLRADSPCGQQLGDTDQVVGGGGEHEEPLDQRTPAMTRLAQAADRLHPAEGLLDAFALDHADGIAGMARGAPIDRGAAVAGVL